MSPSRHSTPVKTCPVSSHGLMSYPQGYPQAYPRPDGMSWRYPHAVLPGSMIRTSLYSSSPDAVSRETSEAGPRAAVQTACTAQSRTQARPRLRSLAHTPGRSRHPYLITETYPTTSDLSRNRATPSGPHQTVRNGAAGKEGGRSSGTKPQKWAQCRSSLMRRTSDGCAGDTVKLQPAHRHRLGTRKATRHM